MNLLDLIFFFLIGYLVWSILTGYVLKQKMTAYIAGATAAASLIDSDRPLEEKVMIVKTEIIKINQDKELVLLYDRNDCFLGQGSTEAEERQNAQSWKQLLDKYNVNPVPKRVPKRLETGTYSPPKIFRRETPHIPSLGTGIGTAIRQPDKVYTGNKIIGIGTLHKSNAVPVFSNEDAIAISKMRR